MEKPCTKIANLLFWGTNAMRIWGIVIHSYSLNKTPKNKVVLIMDMASLLYIERKFTANI